MGVCGSRRFRAGSCGVGGPARLVVGRGHSAGRLACGRWGVVGVGGREDPDYVGVGCGREGLAYVRARLWAPGRGLRSGGVGATFAALTTLLHRCRFARVQATTVSHQSLPALEQIGNADRRVGG